MKKIIKFLMSLLFFMVPIIGYGYTFCVINHVTSDNDIPLINATIFSVPQPEKQPNFSIQMAELDFISNMAPFNKACYQVTSATQYKSTNTDNSAIRFAIVATPGAFAISITCEALYPDLGYPQYAAAKITGNADTNGPYHCTTCATHSGSCNPL